MFSTIHEKTLIDVATLLVGPQATTAILAVYQLVDKAQAEAYELGHTDAQQGVEEATADAFDQGYELGEMEGQAVALTDIEARVEAAGDLGYIKGVSDARARPADADEIVADICAQSAEELYDYFDPSEYTQVEDDDFGADNCNCYFCVETRAMYDND
jgi:flagellar biosynthesis/type III secretory pathway protein FliH